VLGAGEGGAAVERVAVERLGFRVLALDLQDEGQTVQTHKHAWMVGAQEAAAGEEHPAVQLHGLVQVSTVEQHTG
jgi:hypothetical protein